MTRGTIRQVPQIRVVLKRNGKGALPEEIDLRLLDDAGVDLIAG
jgi:hypothetical protein